MLQAGCDPAFALAGGYAVRRYGAYGNTFIYSGNGNDPCGTVMQGSRDGGGRPEYVDDYGNGAFRIIKMQQCRRQADFKLRVVGHGVIGGNGHQDGLNRAYKKKAPQSIAMLSGSK